MRPRSISTGSSCPTAPAAACCCRSSAPPMAQALESGEIELRYDPAKAAFRPGTSSIGCRSRRNATAKSCAWSSRRRAPKTARPAARSSPGLALPGPASSQPQGGARLQGGAEGDPGAAEIIARGLAPIAPGRIAPRRRGAAPSARTPALQARPLAACLQRHQLPALLRHQHAGGLAGRGRRHLRGDPSAGQTADRGGQASGAAARPYRRAARSRRSISSACAGWSATPRAAAASPSTW